VVSADFSALIWTLNAPCDEYGHASGQRGTTHWATR